MCNLLTGLLWHHVELFLHIAELKTLTVVFHTGTIDNGVVFIVGVSV
jgi:hypothetical protein